MALVTMYPAKDGSPETTTTALLSDSDVVVYVAELSCFPAIGAEEGNECTLWNDTTYETCLYTAKSSASGAGTLTIVRSGTVHSSTSGGGIEWPVGTKIARTHTAYDYNAVKANIETLDSGKVDIDELSPLGLSLVGETTATSMRDLIAAASSTTATQNIYVDKAATGNGTGVDWTNAFVTIQAAIDSLPAIIAHNVVILVRKCGASYNENIVIKRNVTSGSITVRGEYYWSGNNASSKTGKIDISSSDPGYANRAQIAAGDKVLLIKWSGTVGASAPLASYADSVASVSGTEIKLSSWTLAAFDTNTSYLIVKTPLSTTSGTLFRIQDTNNVTLSGLWFVGTGGAPFEISNSNDIIIQNIYANALNVGANVFNSRVTLSNGYLQFNSSIWAAINVTALSYIVISNCRLYGGTESGARTINLIYGSIGMVRFNDISAGTIGIAASYGAFCYASTTNFNQATTPKSPASGSDYAVVI